MRKCFSVVLLMLFVKITTAQYRGGSNDGFSSSSVSNLNPLPSIYLGGSNDGFSFSSVANINPLPSIYLGGSNDGFSFSSVTNINPLPSIYLGGSNDGFSLSSVTNLNPLPSIYLGGSNDGFSFSFVANQNCTGDTVSWTGNASINWDNPANWACQVLPTINSVVIIPAGRPRYPTVFFTYEIKSLLLQTGSSVTVQPGVLLKLNGQ